MHSYCRRKGNKSLKLSPIPNTVFSSKTYGLMHLFLGAYPLESGCSHLPTVGEENFNGR